MSELIERKGGIHAVLQAIENALGSDWIGPVLLAALVSTDRIDWFTGLVLCILYVNVRHAD